MKDNLTVKQVLSSIGNSEIYFQPNPGNGGDAMIACGTLEVFRELRLAYVLVDDGMDLTGRTVVFGGGGNLVEEYDFAADFIKKWHRRARRLIVLPHTVNAHQKLLAELSAGTVIFCRERVSYEYVRKSVPPEVKVYLDHDMALHLKTDGLGARGRFRGGRLYLQALLRKRFRQVGTLYAMRDDLESTELPVPGGNVDVSLKILYCSRHLQIDLIYRNTRDIFAFIDRFQVVHTNRTHIAVGACLLAKKIYFYPNSYYKNRAVFEYSLQGRYRIDFVADADLLSPS